MNQMQTILRNWKKKLTVDETCDLSDPIISKTVKKIEDGADYALNLYSKNAGEHSLFLDHMPEKSSEMTHEFVQLNKIAKSWASYGTKHYKDPEVLHILKHCVEWMYENRYGQNELNECGWRSPKIFNWWDWDIGSPKQLIDTLICLGNEVSKADCKRYLTVFDTRVPAPRDYGSNRIEFAKSIIGSAILTGEEKKIHIALDGIKDTNIYVDGGLNDKQGFYTDGSYIFHTLHPMNGTYGAGHFSTLTELVLLFRGTDYLNPELEKMVPDIAENAFLPFISRTIVSRSVMGRYPDNGAATGLRLLAVACECAEIASGEQRKRILDTVKLNLKANPELAEENALNSFYSSLSPEALKLIREAMNDDSYGEKPYRKTKLFGNEDRFVHHYDGVAFSLSMSSSRIYNYECINHINLSGWYLGDGMLSAWGDDFYAYKQTWNKQSPYHRPGTTLDLRPRDKVSIKQKKEYLSSQDFVGGVTSGNIGGAAMRLESYHAEGIPEELVGVGDYGGYPPNRKCTLLAKKSYFFKGKTAICLGADINASDDAPVVTVIDSRYTSSTLKYANGAEINLSEELLPIGDDIKSLYIEGFGGYVFMQSGELLAGRCGENNSFIDILFSHGTNPKNASYAYALLPSYSEEEVKNYETTPEVSILRNDAVCQAVKYTDGTLIATFWESGELEDLKAETPCMVIVEADKITISDPTQKQSEVKIKLGDKEYCVNVKDSYGASFTFDK